MAGIREEIFSTFENMDSLYQFLHDCVNGLSSDNTVKPGSDSDYRGEKLETATKSIQNYYRQRAVQESFPIPSELPENVAPALEIVFKSRYNDIVDSVIKDKLIGNAHNLVETFDWKLKWILGSSKLANIREPICQIELSCASIGKDLRSCKTSVSFECNLEKLDELISVLSKAKNELNTISC